MKLTRGNEAGPVRHAWLWLALFVAMVAFLGGSSRADVPQIVGLRPLAALFLIPALLLLTRDKLAPVKAPFLLLLALTVWMALQLVPLPPALWQALPGREPVEAMGAQLGMADLWRPISLVPSRGMNALASLVVPIAGILLAAALGTPRRTILLAIVALGAANALLGIIQVVGGGANIGYFYAITNFGSPVGFFANHNHSAVFSALVLVSIAYLASDSKLGVRAGWQRIALAAAFLLVLMVALISGSRAGLLTTLLALGASAILLWHRWQARPRARGDNTVRRVLGVKAIAGLLAAGLAAIILLFAAFDRIPALSRLTEGGTFEDLRWSLLPVLGEMLQTYWLVGSGFGSFEEVYHIYEPKELMLSSYVNQAHNDWLQYAIEGGLPAVVILLLFLVWAARSLLSLARSGGGGVTSLVFWGAVLAIICFASAADYPLRAPLFQLVCVWLLAVFAAEIYRRKSAGNTNSGDA